MTEKGISQGSSRWVLQQVISLAFAMLLLAACVPQAVPTVVIVPPTYMR